MTTTQATTQTRLGKLTGKVALVTGASSGIGSATAKALAQEGAKVVLAARRFEKMKAIADEIRENGGETLVLPVDLSNEQATVDLVKQAYDKWGQLDILVNNAGLVDVASVETADIDSWRKMFEVNALGLMIAAKKAIPSMKAQGGGHIVNLSSTSGLFVDAGLSGYCASKYAVEAFSDALRLEVSKSDRIRITVIEPGPVSTDLPTHIKDSDSRQGILDWFDSIEPLQPEDIASAIVYAVTQPPRVSINKMLIRPTDSDTQL